MGFVRSAGGEFRIEIEVGVGTTVTMLLPQADIRASAAPASVPAAVGPGPKARILLVDHNASARKLLAKALEAFGHDVIQAGDGESSLAFVDHFVDGDTSKVKNAAKA